MVAVPQQHAGRAVSPACAASRLAVLNPGQNISIRSPFPKTWCTHLIKFTFRALGMNFSHLDSHPATSPPPPHPALPARPPAPGLSALKSSAGGSAFGSPPGPQPPPPTPPPNYQKIRVTRPINTLARHNKGKRVSAEGGVTPGKGEETWPVPRTARRLSAV